ncbi:MAG: phosphoribosylformimino-5-aminoimidazole carboxamide ribotide isomerase [Anaerocolumna sp.]
MKLRSCIDIHNGKVKQIVGGSLSDQNESAVENYVSAYDAAYYAALYKKNNLKGGHIILLNPSGTDYYVEDCKQAELALKEYPLGLQVGGGITNENATSFLDMGASHVIVTSYVFRDGKIDYNNLEKLVQVTGKDRLVLDLSCRKKDGKYYIVTDRWQKFTDVVLDEKFLGDLSKYCDEFLIHGVDAEGKAAGIETDLVKILGRFEGIPVTYAGGVSSFNDLELIKKLGNNKVDVTIGSALDLFGGALPYHEVVSYFLKGSE